MRGLIRVFLSGLVVSGAVMTASPADAEPVHGATTVVGASSGGVPLSTASTGPVR
jgi:hypothetical protein